VQEIKKILGEFGGKWAETGSVRWAFDKTEGGWAAKFPQQPNNEDRAALQSLVDELENQDDVQKVSTNVAA